MPLHGNLTAYDKVESTVVNNIMHCNRHPDSELDKLIFNSYLNHLKTLNIDNKTIGEYYISNIRNICLNTDSDEEYNKLLKAYNEINSYMERDTVSQSQSSQR